MRLLIILFFFFATQAFGQMASDETAFLEKIIREKKSDGNIVYTNHISETDAQRILIKLKSERFLSKTGATTLVSISKQERKELERQVKDLTKINWSANLFKDAQMIEQENVTTYFKSIYNQYSETLSNPNNSQLDKSNLLKETPEPYVFEFTPPLYFRENTICLVFMKTLCGTNCSNSELRFYKKENNKWGALAVVSIE